MSCSSDLSLLEKKYTLGVLALVRTSESSIMSCHLISRSLRKQLLGEWLSCLACFLQTQPMCATYMDMDIRRGGTMRKQAISQLQEEGRRSLFMLLNLFFLFFFFFGGGDDVMVNPLKKKKK